MIGCRFPRWTRLVMLIGVTFALSCRAATRHYVAPRLSPEQDVVLSAAVAPGEVQVFVADAESGEPVTEAVLHIISTATAVRTDKTGLGRLAVKENGSVELRVIRVGYTEWRGIVEASTNSGRVLLLRLSRMHVQLHADKF